MQQVEEREKGKERGRKGGRGKLYADLDVMMKSEMKEGKRIQID